MWAKFIQDEKSLKEAFIAQLNAMQIACKSYVLTQLIDSQRIENKPNDLIPFLKDPFLNEAIEILTQSGDQV